jgi:hypothetical protein
MSDQRTQTRERVVEALLAPLMVMIEKPESCEDL